MGNLVHSGRLLVTDLAATIVFLVVLLATGAGKAAIVTRALAADISIV